MSGATVAVFQNQRSFGTPPGSQSYISSGTYCWVAPTGVTSVSVVAVGGGAGWSGNGYGGALGYKNSYSVTPGNSYTVFVGAGGFGISSICGKGQSSYFVNTGTVKGGGGNNSCGPCGATFTGDGGGRGGSGGAGSGAGGYSGHGGSNGAGNGGGGGAGGILQCCSCGALATAAGGGVGLFGEGASGARGALVYYSGSGVGYANGGIGGSGGNSGSSSSFNKCTGIGVPGNGGAYGGGGGSSANVPSSGAGGAVRIVWPGNTRTFPSTCVGSP
jgi:hypothetical protein